MKKKVEKKFRFFYCYLKFFFYYCLKSQWWHWQFHSNIAGAVLIGYLLVVSCVLDSCNWLPVSWRCLIIPWIIAAWLRRSTCLIRVGRHHVCMRPKFEKYSLNYVQECQKIGAVFLKFSTFGFSNIFIDLDIITKMLFEKNRFRFNQIDETKKFNTSFLKKILEKKRNFTL